MIKSVRLEFDKLYSETQKAYLIRVGYSEHWLPKKLCRNLRVFKKLNGCVDIPTFLYEKITGIKEAEISEDEASVIVDVHKPQRKEPIQTSAHDSLTR